MVEWKKLGDLGVFENIGTDKKIVQGEQLVTLLNYVDVYHHKFIDSSIPKMVVSASDKKRINCTVEQGDIFVTPTSETVDDIGHSSVIIDTIPNTVYSYHIMRYRLYEKNMILSYFINFAFDTDIVKKQILKKAQGLTRFGLSKDKFASIQIPIPPLSEQNRIVSILDTFTESIENLKKQITERKKQYEYYRDQLLDLEGKPGVEMKTVKDLCKNICSGGTPSTSHKEYYNGNIPWLRTQEVDWKNIYDTEIKITNEAIANSSAKLIPVNCVIVAMYGATAAKVAINKIPLCTNQACCNLEIDNRIAIYKYVYQWLCKEYYRIKSMGEGSQNNINGKKIKEYQIPLPSIEEQNRIVSILDTFEASISNLEQQLTHRQKQYEYYRNMLLTFDE